MIFIGYNHQIGFPRYGNHHSKYTDSRIVPSFIARQWNRLKTKQPAYQIIEWIIAYRKPYCRECMTMFLEDEKFIQFNEFRNPTRSDRQKIVDRLNLRFRKKINVL